MLNCFVIILVIEACKYLVSICHHSSYTTVISRQRCEIIHYGTYLGIAIIVGSVQVMSINRRFCVYCLIAGEPLFINIWMP